jgi:hypothetical protein
MKIKHMSPSLDVDPNLRVAVPSHMENQLRLYRRLWLAQIDLEEAKATVDEILRARMPIPRSGRPQPLLLSLTTALVVAYARPWIYSRGQSVAEKTVPASLLRTLTSKQRQYHEALIDLRNKEIAHTDADILNLHLWLNPRGDMAVIKTSRDAFTRADLKIIRRILDKLELAIDLKCMELKLILPQETWI